MQSAQGLHTLHTEQVFAWKKTKIIQLEQEEGIVVGDANLNNYITEFYKGLFRPHIPNSFSMDETLRHDIPQVSEEENEMLTAPFIEEEVKMAVFDMEHNKVPGPMVFRRISINFFGKL